jgi:hypothetical protein
MFNKRVRTSGLAVLVCIAAFGATQPLLADSPENDGNTVQAGTCNGKVGHPTITAAISAASAGDTVQVCPGNYPEQVVINKPLKLTGVQSGTMDKAVILPPAGEMSTMTRVVTFPNNARPIAVQLYVQNTQDVEISDLTIDGTNNQIPGGADPTCSVPAASTPTYAGIYLGNSSATITRVATINQIMSPTVNCHITFGILAETNGVNVNLTVADSTIRNYETVGIVVDDHGMNANIVGNSLFGEPGKATGGIQVKFGATAVVSGNLVMVGNQSQGTGVGAIACLGCHGTKFSGNTIVSSNLAIAILSEPGYPSPFNSDSDDTTITSNRILGMSPTAPFQGAIYICSNHNEISGNRIEGTTGGAAILLDGACSPAPGTGNNNVVRENTISDACAGVLVNGGAVGNTISENEFSDVAVTTATGSACPVL